MTHYEQLAAMLKSIGHEYIIGHFQDIASIELENGSETTSFYFNLDGSLQSVEVESSHYSD